MQFLVIARDGKNKNALQRRLNARERHIALSDEAIKKGEQIFGAAMLNENKEMCGSVMVVDFPDRESLNKWLENEPYVKGNVWDQIEVMPCKIGPSFEHIISERKDVIT